MLQNAYFLAKIGADTAENEQHFAEILPTDTLSRLRDRPTGPVPEDRSRRRALRIPGVVQLQAFDVTRSLYLRKEKASAPLRDR